MAAMALCVASAGRSPRRRRAPRGSCGALVAVTAVLVLAGWAAPRAFAVPGLTPARGHWTAMPGAACAALAAVGARAGGRRRPSHAGVGARPGHRGGPAARAGARRRRAARRAGAGPAGRRDGARRRRARPRDGLAFEMLRSKFRRQPGSGRDGGHYVDRGDLAAPRQTPLEVALIAAAALIFIYGAVGSCAGAAHASGAPRPAPGLAVSPARRTCVRVARRWSPARRERRPALGARHAARLDAGRGRPRRPGARRRGGAAVLRAGRRSSTAPT